MVTSLDRRRFSSLMLAGSLGSSRVFAQTSEKLRVSFIPTADAAPLTAAVQRGFFREEGIEVELLSTAGGAAGIPGLIGGSFDIVYSNVVSNLLAVQQGLDIKIVAAGTNIPDAAHDGTDLVALTDSGLKNGRDLEGKSLAVNTRNGVLWLFARSWVAKTGGNPDRVTYREVPFPQMEDAVRQKRVDAAYMIAPFNTGAIAKGGLTSIGKPYTEVQPGVDVGQYITTTKFLADRPKVVEGFARGLRKGADWYNANLGKDAAYEVLASITKLDMSVLRTVPLTSVPTHCDLSQIRKTMGLMIDNKLLGGPVDLGNVVAPIAL